MSIRIKKDDTKVSLASHKEGPDGSLPSKGDDPRPDRRARPTREELAALRWGPAVGDPTPGIVVIKPDRARMMEAIAEGAREPYAVAERGAIMSIEDGAGAEGPDRRDGRA